MAATTQVQLLVWTHVCACRLLVIYVTRTWIRSGGSRFFVVQDMQLALAVVGPFGMSTSSSGWDSVVAATAQVEVSVRTLTSASSHVTG